MVQKNISIKDASGSTLSVFPPIPESKIVLTRKNCAFRAKTIHEINRNIKR